MGKGKFLEYSRDDITVVWKPDLCAHAGECVKGSPEVFKPDERPWVQIDNSSAEEIRATIDKCPSGALSYRTAEQDETSEGSSQAIRIKASKNGPFLVTGELEIEDRDGNIITCEGKTNALCRCGASAVKPFCDGSHTKVSFYG